MQYAFLYADIADALTLAAEGLLAEAAEVLDMGLAVIENLADVPGADELADGYRLTYVGLREMYPDFATGEIPQSALTAESPQFNFPSWEFP